jgi:hypothetical protein
MNAEKKAIEAFVSRFKGTYKKLGPSDIDYRVYDEGGELIAYVEVGVIKKKMVDAYPLPMMARKVVKLCDKRLNPTIIWSCLDGIIYGKVYDLSGATSLGDGEVMMYYKNSKQFKYIRF